MASTEPSSRYHSLFRAEALEHHQTPQDLGQLLQLHSAWIRLAYPLVLLTLASALVFSSVARVHRYAEGPAVIEVTEGSPELLVVLPASDGLTIERGHPVRLELDGFRYVFADAEVVEVSSRALAPGELAERLGTALTFPLSPGARILVTARLRQEHLELDGRTHPYLSGLTGRASIPTHEEPILAALLPATRSLFALLAPG